MKPIEAVDNGEPMVALGKTAIQHRVFDKRMLEYTGQETYVRAGVRTRLEMAQAYLNHYMPHHRLEVVYGYRHPDIQLAAFEQIKQEIVENHPHGWDENSLREEANYYIAAPENAGHPTGGAVDVCIKDTKGREIDMGTGLHEFVKDSYTHSPYISREAWLNRQKLRQCMTAAGFAPFDGEWWHFCYGDKEWAFYYNQANAIYEQINFSAR